MELEELLAKYEEIRKNAVKYEVNLPKGDMEKLFDDNPEKALSMDFSDLLNEYKKIVKITKLRKEFGGIEPQEKKIELEEEGPAIRAKEETEKEEKAEEKEIGKKIVRTKEEKMEKETEERKEERVVKPVVPGEREEILKVPEEEKEGKWKIWKGETMEEEKPEVHVPYLESHEPIIIEVPPELSQPIEEKAKKKVEEIVRTMKESEEVDKSEIMRRMVQLTSELFSEKSTKRKKELKDEIARLKRMLEEKKIQKGGETLLDVLVKEQKKDVDKALENIYNIFKANFDKVKNEYEQALLLAGEEKRKEIDDIYRGDLSAILSQMANIIEKYAEYMEKLHIAEWEYAKGFGGVGENLAEEKIEKIRREYPTRFEKLRNQIEAELKNAMPSLSLPKGKEILPISEGRKEEIPREEKQGEEQKMSFAALVEEINRKKEGELLHYLRSRNRELFMKYFTGELSIHEALKEAKKLLFAEEAEKLGAKKEEIEKVIKEYWE